MGELSDRVAEIRAEKPISDGGSGVYRAGFDIEHLWRALAAVAAAVDVLLERTGSLGGES